MFDIPQSLPTELIILWLAIALAGLLVRECLLELLLHLGVKRLLS